MRLGWAAVLVTMAAAGVACAGHVSAPGPAVVVIRPLLSDAESKYVIAAAMSLAPGLGIDPVSEKDPRAAVAADSVVVQDRQPTEGGGLAAPARYWAAFASFWNPAEDVTFQGLRLAAAGQGADWADLGAPAGPLTVYLARELRPGLESLLGPLPAADTPTVRWVRQSDVVYHLAADEGGITVLPVDQARPRVRSLQVDGVDSVRGMGESLTSPLVERLWFTWQGEAAERLARALTAAFTARPPAVTRLVATGDIIPSRCAYARQRDYNDYRHAFLPTADFLRNADVTVGSLDASLSDAGEPFGCTSTFSLLAPAASVEGLVYAGFDVVTVATNHIKDCGQSFCGDRAFLDTLDNLREAGIAPVGGGEDLAAARRPAVITARGVRFAFLGYDEVASSAYGAGEDSPGTAPLNYGVLAEDVAAALEVADVVVVLNQWGTEYTSLPTQRQLDFAREAVDAGASLVVGNHPHWVQAVEWLDESFVAYALGNFVFDQDWSLETQQGAVLEATFLGRRLAGVRLLPVHIHDQHQPRWAAPDEARSILDRMRQATTALYGVR